MYLSNRILASTHLRADVIDDAHAHFSMLSQLLYKAVDDLRFPSNGVCNRNACNGNLLIQVLHKLQCLGDHSICTAEANNHVTVLDNV